MNITPVNVAPSFTRRFRGDVEHSDGENKARFSFSPKKQPLKTNSITAEQVKLSAYYKSQKPKRSKKTLENHKDYRFLKKQMTPEATRILESGSQIAKLAHSDEVQMWHLLLAGLIDFKHYVNEFENGRVNPEIEARYKTATTFPDTIYSGCDIWRNDEIRQKAMAVVDKHIVRMMNDYVKADQQANSRPKISTPSLCAQTIEELMEGYLPLREEYKSDYFYDNYFLLAAGISADERAKQSINDLVNDLQTIGMTKKIRQKDKHHIEFYDKKADAIWKNLSHGNNVLVLNNVDNTSSYEYLQNSFVNLINKPDNSYEGLNPQDVNIIALNEHATFDYLETMVAKILQDKSRAGKTTVIMGNLFSLIKNGGGQINLSAVKLMDNSGEKDPNKPNVRFVFDLPPETFHANTEVPTRDLARCLLSYAQQTLPVLNATDAKEYLTNESGISFIKSKIDKEVSAETIQRAIEITSSKAGNYPDKAIGLIDATAKYFVSEEEITSKHIDAYVAETESLTDAIDTDERSIIFDTGKKLSDIKGMPMSVADAKSIVRQIKNGTIGTRGYVIRHSSGSSYGGGRRHLAEAIAGEAQIPMITINAKDFALKDIDALSQQANLSELKIKKIISDAKAQAEANSLNTAMIYIENFDNFASNPLYGISSIYEQKAFSQLLSEMDAIRKDGKINLVVMGSMNLPDTLDENVMKPYKFLNQIVIYQPQDSAQRREVIDYYIEKNNLNIANDNAQQREKILRDLSESTEGFRVVDLMYLLDNARIISQEREKTAIDNADFTESFLQTTTGRTNPAHVSDARKKIVTSHEAGHALTLHLMYEIAKKQNTPWHLGNKVDFITLDPRGWYGGAMYHKQSENEEWSFEKLMSDLVCDYGGHSSENIIYNMQGSWGITEDMRMAATSAKQAVVKMGMGAKTGVRHTLADNFVSEKQKEDISADIDILLKSAKKISDAMVSEYKDFIEEFTEKYYSKVATGECIIHSSEFLAQLETWRERQTPEKKEKLLKLEQQVLKDIDNAKKGIVEN